MFRNPVRRVTSQTLGNTLERRTFLIGSIQAGIGTLLAGRMAYIAVAENERYAVLAESNRVNLSLIPPRRGWILDRNGAPLASNRADFRVDIIPERVKDAPATVAELGKLLDLDEVEQRDLLASIEEGAGFSPVEVKSSIDFDKFAAVSVRLPELPGVIPQRGFSRYYPTGPAVGHLLGYVGVANKEEFDEAGKDPLLVTPGYRIGKDGLEKQFEAPLRGVPGARRTEVTASGRIVRDLETREDVQGDAVKLAIDGPLQDYAARRLGLESGSVVVMDCESGDIVCMASMPSFDPNSFSQGIGSVEWKMLSEDDHVPLRNKVLKGLYPPGSTVKPMHCMAFLQAGIKPTETIVCGGGRRIGNRFFNCWSNHGVVDMAKAIYQSCDSYFYHFAQQIGFDPIAQMAETTGLGQEFDLPVASQFYGTVPNPAWKEKKYGDPWRSYDTVNSSIGQGYYLVNPLQLAVMSSRLATGKMLVPRLVVGREKPKPRSFAWDAEHIRVVREAMSDVVNGPGTAGRARLPLDNIQMAGKTGTAQVVSLSVSDGKSGPWKYRDHGLFVFFAPVEKPRYAGAVVIEHGGGSSAAYPIARDVMTYLFDPQKALEQLYAFENEWGGKPGERQLRKYRTYAEAAGVDVPRAPQDIAAFAARVDAEARARVVTAVEEDAQSTARPSRDGSPDSR
ncbi:penicillin-binding protein 2 [Alteriqipengyuania flavescens]|uniref:penicillin-binding protein 2 n=1 Tax=Alteriqipengyuania flavescens TaxID=3053610 RepID=UPI0025B42340|nr:penicillin-binding protein 2 [Alteriqipengyuania flavescens]WJY18314.1 penicillin-binding protein 2 [Alteriqipengyuania flavescens]WJY24255.1 penicillin-binding protein 2 [Alteriqipengyuania flavescens]